MKQTIEEFNTDSDYEGFNAVILAGGTSLTRDVRTLFQMGVTLNLLYRIGINHHANILLPDWAVVEDRPGVQLMEGLEGFTIIFGRHDLADVDISSLPNWENSGMNAVYLADYMGFGKIYLAGFDCWEPKGLRWHWHDHIYAPPPWDYAEQRHLEIMEVWKEVRDHCKRPERIQALSGKLQEIFNHGG